MRFKVLFIIILIIIINGCVSPTAATIPTNFYGTYISTDIILQQDYLYVKVDANGILTWFGSSEVVEPPQGNNITIISNEFIAGVEPNYSFQNVDITGSLVFLDKRVKVTFYRNKPPYVNAQSVTCVFVE